RSCPACTRFRPGRTSTPCSLPGSEGTFETERRRWPDCGSPPAPFGFRELLQEKHLIEEGGVVLPVGIEADERNGVRAGRHREAGRRIGRVAGGPRRVGAHYVAVNLCLERLAGVVAVAALGGQEGEAVGAGREGGRLADAGEALEEGDLGTLRGVGV